MEPYSPLRILRIADVADNRTGGMARFMHFGSDEMRAAGHTVDLVFGPELAAATPGKLRRFSVPFSVLGEVRRRAKTGRTYDVVEIHEPSAAAYAAARRFDRSLPPLIVISHGVESRCQRTMHDYSASKGDRIGLKARYAYRLTALWQSDHALRNADQVILSTLEDRDYLINRLRVPADRVTIVNGGITRTFLDCAPRSPDASGVLFLASWIDRKGIRDLVPAVSRLLEGRPNTPVTLAGFGCPTETAAAAFPAEIRERIRYIPHVSGEESLLELYRQNSIYLAPSIFEGQLLTMLEAAAAGLAIIGSNCCGMKDFVRPGETGILVEPGQADTLADAILKLVDHPDLAARYGENAQRAAREYTWARSAHQFLTAARLAVSRNRNRNR